jgi:hypothetical protein
VNVAGAFTNQIQKGFEEPRLLIVTDPRTDHQSIKEAAYMNIPVIAFCDTDSDLQVRLLQRGVQQHVARRVLCAAMVPVDALAGMLQRSSCPVLRAVRW